MSTISMTLGQRNVKIDAISVKNDINNCGSVCSPVTSSLMIFYIWEIISSNISALRWQR